MTALRALDAHGGGTVESEAVLVDEVHDHLEGLAGVGDVVDDEDALTVHRGNVHERGKELGLVEGFADAGVELDVHGADGLDVHRVGDGARRE